MANGGNGRKGNEANARSFETFLEHWLVRQEHYLDELLSAQQYCHKSRDEDHRELISRVLSHYQQYYEEKSRIAQSNILLVFSPSWFSSFERACLWIAGFKPGLVIRLVMSSVGDLSEDQNQRLKKLISETKAEERALNDELAKIHESVAAPPLVEVVMNQGRLINGEISQKHEALNSLKAALETVLMSADSLRTNTAVKVVEILRPSQSVKFLTAAAQLQLKLRSWGAERDTGSQKR
ncbi:Transcription factor [Quillaja saponaria]|uniref:Transcription factor n=1 Tax=Quillaja saponaria TaxID=32244 RepID=A0AAD7L340_QUISA|nr:Transcription factor [Quillaja saponaria]